MNLSLMETLGKCSVNNKRVKPKKVKHLIEVYFPVVELLKYYLSGNKHFEIISQGMKAAQELRNDDYIIIDPLKFTKLPRKIKIETVNVKEKSLIAKEIILELTNMLSNKTQFQITTTQQIEQPKGTKTSLKGVLSPER